MNVLRAASVRHLLRHRAQLVLALAGLTLGVAGIVGVDVAAGSARRAFELSLAAVNGAATHRIVGGTAGLDEADYVRLRRTLAAGGDAPALAPVVTGYATVGTQAVQLAGIDPPASIALDPAAAAPGAGRVLADGGIARAWFAEPGAVIVSTATASQLGLPPDGAFELAIGGTVHAARAIARLTNAGPGFDGLLLTDIAQAQEWLGMRGRISRIDLRFAAGASGAAQLAQLKGLLPAGATLESTRAAARETFAMTDAFTTNLRAMSLLALMVGALLIYASVSFAVVQRRGILAVLRALGATPREVLGLVLGEAAVLGIVGASCGVLAGLLLAQALVRLVARTINDLYFVLAVTRVSASGWTLAAALAVGVATALAAALLPALEAARGAPALTLARSGLEERARAIARYLVPASLACALAAAAVVALSARSLGGGFVALFLLLVAVAALTPAAVHALATAVARHAGRGSAVLRFACTDIAGSLSRTGVAAAALGMALAAMVGVAVMVASFRESLRDWLTQTLRADIYVSAPGVAESFERRLDPALLEALLAVPGIIAHSEARRASVGSPHGPVDVNAVRLAPASREGFRLTAGEAAQAWPRFAHGEVLVSEPLAWRLGLAPGDALTLETAAGARAFRVAAVYREYGNERGEVLMDLDLYRRLWHDEAIAAVGLYLAPGVPSARVVEELRAAAVGRQALLIRPNAQIRTLSLEIFERTFVITRVLYWLSAAVAATGLVSALLAWELARARELALLRTLGLTPRGTALLVLAQSTFMGIAAWLAAVPAGLLTALVLTKVINRRAFGWQIALHVHAAQFGDALGLALVAALAAALYPAWRCARLVPAAALREE